MVSPRPRLSPVRIEDMGLGASLKIGIGKSKATREQSHCATTVNKSAILKGPRQRRGTNQGAPSACVSSQFHFPSTPMAPLPMAKAMQPSRGSVMSGVAFAAPGPLEAPPLGGLSNLSLPLSCPLHEGGKGWTIADPCLACIALAMGEEPVRPFPACDPGNTPGEASCSPSALNAALIASDSMTGTGLQEGGASAPGSLGGSPPNDPPSPPSPVACVRHRKGRGWSLSNPCQDCLDLAMRADL